MVQATARSGVRWFLDRMGFSERPLIPDASEYASAIAAVRAAEAELRGLDHDGLRARADQVRARVASGQPSTNVRVEAIALAVESARRFVGLHCFDVQIAGALAMADGRIAQMNTGEGKTLSAVPVAILLALAGRGVHVLTVNDYLARRDAAWMGPAYRHLGLDVGSIGQGMTPSQRRAAYACDVTYVTANEAGFDFLRDNMAPAARDVVHRPLHAAVIDEIDSLLIDEARVPLVVAGGSDAPDEWVARADELVRVLPHGDVQLDNDARSAQLTAEGRRRVEEALGSGSLNRPDNEGAYVAIHYALQAHAMLRRDVDYVVKDGSVAIVDEFKGRIAHRRRWPDGLQSAVEAKEGVPITAEARILSTIALQDLARLYPFRCGMTATAASAAIEFFETYRMKVVVVGPNRPCVRVDGPDVMFATKAAKQRALVEAIRSEHARGRPVLVGTGSVAESEELAASLRAAGLPCEVLNARDDAREAEIIAEAGAAGAVTISTNMAGRGVDIRLGGSSESGRDPVVATGGLLVIGTNRHEALRIDDQLRGRAGRQGDPGESRFFVSLEDDIVVRYAVGELIQPDAPDPSSDEPIGDPRVAVRFAKAQRSVDWLNSKMRQRLAEHASVVEEQRRAVHGGRGVILGAGSSILSEDAPDLRARLVLQHGENAVAEAERQVALFHIDDTWSSHLQDMRDLRELLSPLHRGRLPVGLYRERSAEAFIAMRQAVRRRTVETMASVAIGSDGADLEGEGLVRPTATWTYQLADTPLRSEQYHWLDLLRSMLRDGMT